MSRRARDVFIACSVCSKQFVSSVRSTCQPFVSHIPKTFTAWLTNASATFTGTMCADCSKATPSAFDVWQQSDDSMQLEVESRVKRLCAGILELTPSTRVELRAGKYRLRDGEAIYKQYISTENVFNVGGNFVRRVASLESWPVPYYTLLANTNVEIDWSRPRLVDRESHGEISRTRTSHPSMIGYYEIWERETNYKQPQVFESLPIHEYETFPFTLNTTHVPSASMMRRLINDPLTRFSPKVDGRRMHANFTPSGMYIKDPQSGRVSIISFHIPDLVQLPTMLAEQVTIDGGIMVHIIIDVCIDADVIYRVAMIEWMIKFREELSLHNIFLQQYFCKNEKWDVSANYGGLDIPVDGSIASPAYGKTQFKIKREWTIDLDINREKLVGASCDGYRVVRFASKDLNSQIFTGNGIYECLVSKDGVVKLIRKRTDKSTANNMYSIVQNIEMSVLN